MTKIACVQSDVSFGEFDKNCERTRVALAHCASHGADLVVFPECSLTGYCVTSHDEASRIAIEAGQLAPIQQVVDDCGALCIVGFAEQADAAVYNSAALLEPGVQPRIYRKTHLPELGLDKFVKPGSEIQVFGTKLGAIGLLICFDLRHPEPSRVLALQGADIIVLPTNWPEGAHAGPNFTAATRAAENRVFFATCNRVGTENGFAFIGQSGIYDVTGQTLAKAGIEEETIWAEVDLSQARTKRTVVRPGEYEITVFDSRRPELYGAVTKPLESR